jgi:hypothetical protein
MGDLRRMRLARLGAVDVAPQTEGRPSSVARLANGGESVSHETVCLGVPLPRKPADADALELSGQTGRNLMQLAEFRLSHRGAVVHLLHHELGVHVDAEVPNMVGVRELQALDQRPVLGLVVTGRTNRLLRADPRRVNGAFARSGRSLRGSVGPRSAATHPRPRLC